MNKLLDNADSRVYFCLVSDEEHKFLPLGSFLRKKRQEKGLSVRAVSELIAQMGNGSDMERVSPAYLCDIENSRREPSDCALKMICGVLGLNESDIAPYDARVPNQELKDLALSNKNYGIAFRRMVTAIHEQNISPEELLKKFGL